MKIRFQAAGAPGRCRRRGLTASPCVLRVVVLTAVVILCACQRSSPGRLQGYIEGEFVYIASPFPGALTTLHVNRGAGIKKGDLLFTLDDAAEKASRDAAEHYLMQARAALEDAKKGKRPSEIESLSALLRQAQATFALAEKEAARQEQLMKTPGMTSVQEVDRARSVREQARQRIAQIEADLETAQLGARLDQVAAAEANVQALEAALVKAEWSLSQKRQAAPADAVVLDTLYREGEWVPAGQPVVVLLPPGNVKLRTFVPEVRLGSLRLGDQLEVTVDGLKGSTTASISFISPRAEYAPPVIYSREQREKFVYLVEAEFSTADAVKFHPGQPVDVYFHRSRRL